MYFVALGVLFTSYAYWSIVAAFYIGIDYPFSSALCLVLGFAEFACAVYLVHFGAKLIEKKDSAIND